MDRTRAREWAAAITRYLGNLRREWQADLAVDREVDQAAPQAGSAAAGQEVAAEARAVLEGDHRELLHCGAPNA